MRSLILLCVIVFCTNAAKDRVQKEEMSLLPKFTSVYEGFSYFYGLIRIVVITVSQIIGENFRQKYPDIFDKDDLTSFKKELLEFFILIPEDMDKVGDVQTCAP